MKKTLFFTILGILAFLFFGFFRSTPEVCAEERACKETEVTPTVTEVPTATPEATKAPDPTQPAPKGPPEWENPCFYLRDHAECITPTPFPGEGKRLGPQK